MTTDDRRTPNAHSGKVAPRPMLQVRNLCVAYGDRGIPVVRDVSLEIARGGALGLIGESGSGKSTLARAILGLLPAASGRILFDGQSIEGLGDRRLRPIRRRMQFVFQDTSGSLNPRRTVFQTLSEPIRAHRLASGADVADRVHALLNRVGLSDDQAGRYPHEFSGGQRQRIGIARALACDPDFIIFDEPVSALDVSVQAQILNLILDLRSDLGLTYLLIGHNLDVIAHCCDEIAVMHGGQIVEYGPALAVRQHAGHPYTRQLLAAALSIEDLRERPAGASEGMDDSPRASPAWVGRKV